MPKHLSLIHIYIVDKISTRVDTDPEAPVEVHHAAGSVGKNVVQLIEEGKIDMILNTPNSRGSRSDGYSCLLYTSRCV